MTLVNLEVIYTKVFGVSRGFDIFHFDCYLSMELNLRAKFECRSRAKAQSRQ